MKDKSLARCPQCDIELAPTPENRCHSCNLPLGDFDDTSDVTMEDLTYGPKVAGIFTTATLIVGYRILPPEWGFVVKAVAVSLMIMAAGVIGQLVGSLFRVRGSGIGRSKTSNQKRPIHK